MSLLSKLWNKSPKSVFQALNYRINRSTVKPEWREVKSGPFKGGQLFVAAESFSGWNEMISGSFDSFIYKELISCCNVEGAVFWDIGAHFGYHSFSFASLVGENGHVYSFEPNPFNATRFLMHLEKNACLAGRITLNTFALSDTDGETTFVFSSDVDGSCSSGSHLLEARAPLESDTYNNFQTQIVTTFTIDSIINKTGIKIPDIIKVDVEGAELLVLKGGNTFFAKHKPIIFMEVHNILMMYYVHNFMLKHGYSVRVLDECQSTLSKCFIIATPA